MTLGELIKNLVDYASCSGYKGNIMDIEVIRDASAVKGKFNYVPVTKLINWSTNDGDCKIELR